MIHITFQTERCGDHKFTDKSNDFKQEIHFSCYDATTIRACNDVHRHIVLVEREIRNCYCSLSLRATRCASWTLCGNKLPQKKKTACINHMFLQTTPTCCEDKRGTERATGYLYTAQE